MVDAMVGIIEDVRNFAVHLTGQYRRGDEIAATPLLEFGRSK
jgi:hypothetical protein